MTLTEYEIQVLRTMLKSEYSDLEIESLISTSTFSGYDFTGAGYFLQLSNDLFPEKRKVISDPILIGKADDFQVGFVLYLEDNSLTIECHSWSEKNPPENIRMMDIQLDYESESSIK
jgi:hypothetical protein